MKAPLIHFALLITIGLAGCGGGGSSSSVSGQSDVLVSSPAAPQPASPPAAPTNASPPVPPAVPPTTTTADTGPVVALDSAISTFYMTATTYAREESDPQTGNVYNVTVKLSNILDTTIEGLSVKSVDIRRTVLKNGAPSTDTLETSYFQVAPYRLIASRFADNPLYTVASGQVALPQTAKAGDTGKFYDTKTYESPAKNIVLSTSVNSWSVTPDSATTISFCDNSVTSIAQIPGSSARSRCLKINADGAVVLVGVEVLR